MKLENKLRNLRVKHDWTLKELSQRTELSVSYLSDIERGRTNPSINTLETLASAFEITVIDLLTDVDFAGEKSELILPTGLKQFVESEYGSTLTDEWIEMLSKIELRGKRPETKDDWIELYLHLKRILEND